jgi:hypothetical protein
MNSLRVLRIALVAVFCAGLGACPPVTSKTAVGTTVAATRDPAFTGVWKGRVADSTTFSYFTFLPQDDGTVTVVVVTPPSAKDKGGYGAFTLQTVALGSYHFINARESISDGKPATGPMADNTIPILYRVNGDGAIVIYLIDETAAKNAIKLGKITGTVEQGEYGDVTLTATPGDLDAYLATPAGRALFVKPLSILRKVK